MHRVCRFARPGGIHAGAVRQVAAAGDQVAAEAGGESPEAVAGEVKGE